MDKLKQLNLRVTPELEARIVAYASRKGLSKQAAMVVLLGLALDAQDAK